MTTTWNAFRDALRPRLPGGLLVVACERLWGWLDAPPADHARIATDGAPTLEEARWLIMARPFVSQRLWREAAEAGVASGVHEYAALAARCDAGSATASERRLIRRLWVLYRLSDEVVARWPDAATLPPAPDPRTPALLAAVPDLTTAMRGCDVGRATAAGVEALRAAMAAFDRAAELWGPPPLPDHAWWLGMAHDTLARALVEIGDLPAARGALEEGIERFTAAGDEVKAAGLRTRLEALVAGARGDVDALAGAQVAAFLGSQDPIDQIVSLSGFAESAHQAGDTFEFVRSAGRLAERLVAAGFDDPRQGVLPALQAWTATAFSQVADRAALDRVAQITQCWLVVLGARAMDEHARSATPAPGTLAAEECLRQLPQAVAQLFQAANDTEAEIDGALGTWGLVPTPPSEATPAPHRVDAGAAPLAARQELDEALYALRLACNAGPTPAHLAEAERLVASAQALGSRVHEAQARLEVANVLSSLGRHADVAPVTAAARRALVPSGPCSLSSVSTAAERELYLSAALYDARAHAATRDDAGVLAVCAPVIAEIEEQRQLVSAPYQQAAFLGTRAEFYELAIAAALHTERHDVLLATMERLKAPGVLRLLRPAAATAPRSHDQHPLDRDYADVNRALAHAPPASPAARLLTERRRLLATARALARDQAGSRPSPACTVEAVQGALARDEAAVSWCWLGEEVLVAVACTPGRYHPFRIGLDADDRARLGRWHQVVRALAGPRPDLDALVDEVEELVDRLAPRLFPLEVRNFVAGHARLLLSPHRALHLFPLHAARCLEGEGRQGWLADHVAIRYVPNLTSRLLAWHGNRSGSVLAVGVSHFSNPRMRPLAHAVAEANEVATAHGAHGRVLADATRAAFAAEPLETLRCLHLATHASSVLAGSAADDPFDAGLVLADGVLDGWQISALDLPAELVVLAACHSGQRMVGGRGLARLPGDDVFGLPACLFEAGAHAVLGALWPIDDAAARALVTDVHRAYAAGAPPDVALQRALQLHHADPARRQTRFDWAPLFVTELGAASVADT